MIELSKSRFEQRAAEDWSKYAQEPVKVELIKGHTYAFGSELACLRLLRRMQKGRVEYSKNLQTWFWESETNFVANAA